MANDDNVAAGNYDPAAAARKGFALLTAHGPAGWRENVSISELNMDCPSWCVLGQAYGGFTSGARQLFLAAGLISVLDLRMNDLVREYGFEVPLSTYVDGTAEGLLEELRQEWAALLTDGGED